MKEGGKKGAREIKKRGREREGITDGFGHGKIRKSSSDCFLLLNKIKIQVICSEEKWSKESVRFLRRGKRYEIFISHGIKLTDRGNAN